MCVMAVVAGSMPVLFAGSEPHDITRPDFLDGAALALRPAAARGDHESLPKRVRVPRGACAWLECDAGALHEGRIGRLKKRVDAHSSR